jgi:hypothetical protein
MRQLRTDLGFAFESPQRLAIAERPAEHDLDSDSARQPQICRLVDDAHTASANQPIEPILPLDSSFNRQ